MIGPLLIAVSWLLLKLEGKSLAVLGFDQPGRRVKEFGVGFVVAALVVSAKYLLLAHWSGVPWELNESFGAGAALDGLRWVTNSVLYEELLFRGYLLYQLMRRLGARRGCVLAAVAFGVYHWFSYGVFGSVVPMLAVFVLTGAAGLMFAAAFAASGSLAMPVGLHLGWNALAILVFSDGPLGPQLLTGPAPDPIGSTLQALTTHAVLPLLLPALVLVFLWRRIPRGRSDVVLETHAASDAG